MNQPKTVIRQSVRIQFVLLALLLLGTGYVSTAQLPVHLSGPDCVVTGIPYQYLIIGQRDSALQLKICITGGVLIDSASCTTAGKTPPFVMVVWSEGATHGITLNTTAGSNNFPVLIARALTGGEVAEADRVQFYDSTKTQVAFSCSPATGGNCSPDYQYQWQQSDDNQVWQNVSGAISKDLVLTGVQSKNRMYRRMVREIKGGRVAYSNEVQLIVYNQ